MLNLNADSRNFGKSEQIQILNDIFKDLSKRYAQRLVTKELHLSWTTAKKLASLTGLDSIYNTRTVIHRENDSDFKMDWEFR